MGMDIILIDYVNAVYGRQYPVRRRRQWQTDVIPLSGVKRKSQRNQILEQPVRHWFINWQALLIDEQERFIEIFDRAKGAYDTFLLFDRDKIGDYLCGLGDWEHTAVAGETQTRLQKTYYKGESEAWTEDKKNIVPGSIYTPTVKLDSVTKTEDTHFTLDDSTGLIDWTGGSAPQGALSGGEIVTADYHFYFRIRFMMDVHDEICNAPDYWLVMGIHLVEDE